MAFILIFLALGLTIADKLDRSYLPPPGSKYSGGSPGSIDLPLEYPKTSTTDQQLNQNKAFGTLKTSQFKSGRPSDIQIKENAGIPTRSSQGEFIEIQKPIIQSTNDETQNTNYRNNEDESNVNGIISNGFNQPSLNKFQNVENIVNGNDAKYKVEYKNLNKIPKLSLQEQQRVMSISTNTENKLGYPPVLETDQDLKGISLEEMNFRQLPIEKQEEINYSKDKFGLKLPFENNMYKDSVNYGTQTMYRPDVVSSEFNRYSSAPSYSKKIVEPDSDLTNFNINQNMESTLNIYPDKARSQISIISPDLDSISLNEVSTTYPIHKTAMKTYQSTDISPSTIANQVDTILNYTSTERPQMEADRAAYILKYENIITPKGFSYSYDTSNGIHADEAGTANNGVKAKGSYSYIDDSGKVYTIRYTADENGFRPVGDHLPTPPPIPIEIQAALNQISLERDNDNLDDGSYDEQKYGYEKYQGKMDLFSPRLQDLSIEKNIETANDLKKKPYDAVGKKQKGNMKNEIDFQTSERYSNIRPINVIPDTIDKQASVTIPYPKNTQYPENIIQEQNRAENKFKINEVIKGPLSGFKVPIQKLGTVDLKFNSRLENNAPRIFDSNINTTKIYKPTYQVINADDSRQKTINRYLPKTNKNKFGLEIESQNDTDMNSSIINQESKPDGYAITSFASKNSNQPPNNVVNKKTEAIKRPSIQKLTTSTNLKLSYPIKDTKESFDGLDNSKVNDHNGYYYTTPDQNFKDTRYSIQNTTPNINKFRTDYSEYIPTLKTNYDSSVFDFPSTANDEIISYTNRGNNEERTLPYELKQNYYGQKMPLTNYNSEAVKIKPTIGLEQTKLPYNEEYTQDREETSYRPSQKFDYVQPQDSTTPLTADTMNYDGRDMKLSTNNANYYDQTKPYIHDTTNKNIGDVFTGYTYEKPKYGNRLVYKESNPNITQYNLDDSGNKDDETVSINDNNFNNRKDTITPGQDFKGTEANYYTPDSAKNPKYDFVEKANYNEKIIKGSPYSKLRENLDVRGNANKQDTTLPDRPFNTGKDDFTDFVSKATDVGGVGSPYQDNKNTKMTINKENGTFNGSGYNSDNVTRPNVITSERYIGQDFSGPKRPQGFDPNTGYYY